MSSSIFKAYKAGSNLTILNTLYSKVRYDDDKNVIDDVLTLVAIDRDTGVKIKDEIKAPKYTYYMANDDVLLNHNVLFIENEKVHPITCKYRDVTKSIAEQTGNLEFFYNNIANGNRGENNRLHAIPTVFRSDMEIEDYYRAEFSAKYVNDTYSPSKAYFDIEARARDMKGDFPEPGECPIDAITLICEKEKHVFTLLLRDKINPQISIFEEEYNLGKLIPELKEFIKDAIGGDSKIEKYGLGDFEYSMLFYDEEDEINLIKDLFVIINKFQPDFTMAWNMSFDVPYIIYRIMELGYNPEDIMCHPDFDNKQCYYFVDEKHKSEFAERTDYAAISSYTVYLDQMIQFASRRKGQSKFASYKLDYIGGNITGVKKLDYHHICNNLMDLPLVNYKTYVFYNIMDTVVQKCIETVANDVDYVFSKSLENNTKYSKIHRQTVYLTNRASKEFMSEGFIIGNNANKFNEKPKEKFPGAFVADPEKITDYAKKRINGHPVNIFDLLVDFDYTRLYPSTIQENNMAPNTQIGKIIIDNPVHDLDNRFGYDRYDRGGAFIEDFQSGNYIEFCKRWLHLAGFSEVIDDIYEYDSEVCQFINRYMASSFRVPKQNIKMIRPIQYIKDNERYAIRHINKTVDEDMKARVKYVNKPSGTTDDK